MCDVVKKFTFAISSPDEFVYVFFSHSYARFDSDIAILSVRPSVCLSHTGIVLKWLK